MRTVAAEAAFLEIYPHPAVLPRTVSARDHLEGAVLAETRRLAVSASLCDVAFLHIYPGHLIAHFYLLIYL